MPCREKGRQIAAHAGADQRHRFISDRAFNHPELAGDGKPPEIRLGQVGNFDADPQPGKTFPKKPRLLGPGTAGKAVQVDEPAHLESSPAGPMDWDTIISERN